MTEVGARTFCPCCGWDVRIDEDGLCVHCGTTAYGEAVDALVAEIARIKGETYCAYCGERFPLDAPDITTQIGEHIAQCDKHPMRGVEAERDAGREALVEITRQRDALETAYHETKRALAEAARPAIYAFGQRALQIVQSHLDQYVARGDREKAEAVRILLDQLSGLIVP